MRHRVGAMWRAVWSRRLGIAVVVAGALAGAVMSAAVSVLVLRGPVEWWLGGRSLLAGLEAKDRVAAVNSARQIALAAAAGTAALVGLGFTARTYYLSRRGQLTDRYTRAIPQLPPGKPTQPPRGNFPPRHPLCPTPPHPQTRGDD